MSKLRNTKPATDGSVCPRNGTAYLLILNAVKTQQGLIHGKLDGPYGEHCAVGSYFAVHEKAALPVALIDEVALVNDSVPNATPRQRKLTVMRWLRWKLKKAGLV